MTLEGAPHDQRERHARLSRWFRWHATTYGVLMGALLVGNIAVGGGWWSFWPMCAWGLVLALHFLYYKSVTVDEGWVEERVGDLRMRSYDLSHIRDIEGRVDEGDASMRPSDERDR